MSILCPSHVRRNAKATRPATIRPVPSTFGQGVLEDDPCRMTDAEFETHLYADVKPSDVAAVKAAERRAKQREYRVSPSTLDQAWALGYHLGRLGVEDAAPHAVSNPRERRAFCEGHDKGLAEYHRDEIAAAEAWCIERGQDGPDVWGDPAEFNVGGLVGCEW